MFRHVVMFSWNDDVDEADLSLVTAGLDGMPAAIPEIRGYHHGPDAGVADGNFDSVEDYVVYRDHPSHRALINDVFAGQVSARAAVQYELEG